MLKLSKGVSREEWMWRSLAIIMVCATVEITVMPVVQPLAWYFTLAYNLGDAALSAGSTFLITATAGALIATGSIGFAGASALGIMVTLSWGEAYDYN